jgi:hypothetical protein
MKSAKDANFKAVYFLEGNKYQGIGGTINIEVLDGFYGCRKLTKVYFKDAKSLKYINSQAFSFTSALKDINLPNSIEYIGDSAFYNSKVLNLTALPENLNYLGIGAFRQCSTLSLNRLPINLITIPTSCFADCPNIAISHFGNNGDLVDANDNNIKYILPNAFANSGKNSGLSTLTLKGSVNFVGTQAFHEYFGTGTLNLNNYTELTFTDRLSSIFGVGRTV